MSVYNLLVIDAPYDFSDSYLKRGASSQYQTMTNDAIKKMKISELADKNAVLALWVPSTLLSFGLELIDIWGFDYKQMWVWNKIKKDPLESLRKDLRKKSKNKMVDLKDIQQSIDKFDLNNIMSFGMGRIARNVHEICLIATRGKVNQFIKNKSQRTVFFDQNYKHSQKPEILQDRLELIFPDFIKKCEIFGRKSRPGWQVIGNEAPDSIGVDINESIEKLLKM